MKTFTSKAVKWTRILLKIPLFVYLAIVILLSYLSIIEPVTGFLPKGGLESFNYGILESLYGYPNEAAGYDIPLYIRENAAFLLGRLSFAPIVFGLTLLAFNKRKKKSYTAGLIFILLDGLAQSAPFGIVAGITLLVLRFRHSVKHHFTTS